MMRPREQECSRGNSLNGMVKMAQDAQYLLLQGNNSNTAFTTAGTEAGAPYVTANTFDGFRGTLGSFGTFAGNNAVQLDIGSLNITESIQSAAAKIANNGGSPTTVFMSIQGKQALDIEQQQNRRYNDDLVDIIPGVRANKLAWAKYHWPTLAA